jgi:hypothetical protein
LRQHEGVTHSRPLMIATGAEHSVVALAQAAGGRATEVRARIAGRVADAVFEKPVPQAHPGPGHVGAVTVEGHQPHVDHRVEIQQLCRAGALSGQTVVDRDRDGRDLCGLCNPRTERFAAAARNRLRDIVDDLGTMVALADRRDVEAKRRSERPVGAGAGRTLYTFAATRAARPAGALARVSAAGATSPSQPPPPLRPTRATTSPASMTTVSTSIEGAGISC